jgi:hypothetical protein
MPVVDAELVLKSTLANLARMLWMDTLVTQHGASPRTGRFQRHTTATHSTNQAGRMLYLLVMTNSARAAATQLLSAVEAKQLPFGTGRLMIPT